MEGGFYLAVDNFQRLTGYDLKKYMTDVENFFKFSYPVIVDYFNGVIDSVNQSDVLKMNNLNTQAQTISIQFRTNKTKLNTVDYWELYDFLEDLRTKLKTTTKISKYLRSSRTNFNYSNSFNFPFTIGQNQTLEDISNDILQDPNPEDDWTKTALKNNLLESDYSIDGGDRITLFKEFFVGGFVQSVVDNMIGEKIYGLDLNKKLTFINDDLEVLSYKDTVFQCANILANLKQGDIPEIKSMGVPSSILVGGDLQSFSIPSIINALNNNFATDDLFMNFTIVDIAYSEGSYKLSYTVKTKYQLLVQDTAVI